MGSGLPVFDEMAPGTIGGIHLVVNNIDASRAELVERGVHVSDIDDSAAAESITRR